jgi:HD superfamily phosphohydrolase
MLIIKDVIYKFIKIPELYKHFIDTYEFGRLRRIKQLGFVYFVFASANHTRFEHCTGVMNLAGKVADILKLQGVNITEREKELLQLAGLLHDIGHTAFSHFFDYILTENDQESKESFIHHEKRSIFLLNQINNEKKLLTEREIEIVEKMILGNFNNEEKPFLFEIVKNKEFGLDVDRLDYLQRDMYYTGMPCFQSDYILECIKVKNGRISILKKSLSEIEMLYEARKRLLLIVCRHKTVIKIENMFREFFKKHKLNNEWFLKNWYKLTDEKMLNIIEELDENFIKDIYTRNWKNISIENRLNHIELINKNEIEEIIKKVIWYEE